MLLRVGDEMCCVGAEAVFVLEGRFIDKILERIKRRRYASSGQDHRLW